MITRKYDVPKFPTPKYFPAIIEKEANFLNSKLNWNRNIISMIRNTATAIINPTKQRYSLYENFKSIPQLSMEVSI